MRLYLQLRTLLQNDSGTTLSLGNLNDLAGNYSMVISLLGKTSRKEAGLDQVSVGYVRQEKTW